MEKLIYETDPQNRLVVKGRSKDLAPEEFRYVLEGEFKTDRSGSLVYHIKAPSKSLAKQLDLPYQLKLQGTWSLTENHDLRFTFDKWKRSGASDELILRGEIVGAESDTLLFAIVQKRDNDTVSTRTLKIEGAWQADELNRLAFRVKKEKDRYDRLTFEGIWEIDKNHQIVYSYEKRFSEGGGKAKRSLLLSGFWNITEKNAITYHLDFLNRSILDFKVGFAGVAKDAIRYEIGIGLASNERPMERIITLYGRWKIEKRIGLVFEIDYGNGSLGGIAFGAQARLADGSKVEFDLKAGSGEPLGMRLILSKSILKGAGELYARLLTSGDEKAVYIGAGFAW